MGFFKGHTEIKQIVILQNYHTTQCTCIMTERENQINKIKNSSYFIDYVN
jgi:hypothetical protein